MIEVDASMTTDKVFYAFHNGEEPLELGIDRDIRTMSSEEVEKLFTLNSLRQVCGQKLEHLEDVLEHFRGKCLINIDRSWFYWKEIIALLDRMDMKDQILLKSGVEEELLKELPGVAEVSREPGEAAEEVLFHVTAERGEDIREALFHACAKEEIPVLEMHTETKSLEDVFLELTGADGKGEQA